MTSACRLRKRLLTNDTTWKNASERKSVYQCQRNTSHRKHERSAPCWLADTSKLSMGRQFMAALHASHETQRSGCRITNAVRTIFRKIFVRCTPYLITLSVWRNFLRTTVLPSVIRPPEQGTRTAVQVTQHQNRSPLFSSTTSIFLGQRFPS